MTMKIEVFVPQDEIASDTARRYLARAMSAIGFTPDDMPMPVQNLKPGPCVSDAEAKEIVERVTADDNRANTEQADAESTNEPARERGKPAPGKARRTKAEIEEDEAADEADAAKAAEAAEASADDSKPGISTGEERVDPNAEQDAEDEAADPVNSSGEAATRDDVRNAMKAFMDKHGLAKLNEDMSSILKAQFPDGNVTKLSEIPEDAEAFAAVIEALGKKAEG